MSLYPATEQCPHGFPKKTNCILCMEEGPMPPEPQWKHKVSSATVASYEGRCAGCSHPIQLGDLIGFAEGVGWICEACIE